MDPDSGHLVRVAFGQALGEKYVQIPEHLNAAAAKVLGEQNEAYVSLNSGGKLSRWAARQRKAKRKVAKASRKRNRR